LQAIECIVQDALPVEVDLAPVRRGKEAVAFSRQQPGHHAMSRGLRELDVSPLFTDLVLQ
jgi:hypothetical protein